MTMISKLFYYININWNKETGNFFQGIEMSSVNEANGLFQFVQFSGKGFPQFKCPLNVKSYWNITQFFLTDWTLLLEHTNLISKYHLIILWPKNNVGTAISVLSETEGA